MFLEAEREDFASLSETRTTLAVPVPALPGPAIRARIRHPFLFGHSSWVSVAEFHKDFHILFASPDPALIVLPGMVLGLELALPGGKPQAFRARVEFVEEPGVAVFRFGVRAVSMSHGCNDALSSHLMSDHRWTPADLRRAGFRVRDMEDQFRIGTASTAEEYAEVLKLRRDAYVRVGKRSPATTADQMAGALDPCSRILIARHHGRLVGSMSLAFVREESTVLDTQRGFPGETYPVRLPPKQDLVEIARLCVAEEYRGTDFVQRLFAEGFKQFMLTDRKWFLTSSTSEMLPLYKGIGFKTLGAAYPHPLLNGKEHHLILLAKRDVTWSTGMGILAWNQWFGDVAAFLMDNELLAVPAWIRVIMRLKLSFRPLAKWLGRRKAAREFVFHFQAKAQRSGLWSSLRFSNRIGHTRVTDMGGGFSVVSDPVAGPAQSVQSE